MRDYVLKKSNRNYVPKDVMMQVKYRLLGYKRVKKELKEMQRKHSTSSTADAVPLPLDGKASVPATYGSLGGRLTREERKRIKAFEKEVVLIEEACAEMASRLKPYADESFDCISAYFSYEHYNMHIKRSGDPDDAGAGPGKWSGYKRDMTRIVADKFGIV